MKIATVILAAGLGTRMKSARAKVLHSVAGRPLIYYPVALARAAGSERIVCVLGHQAETVRAMVEKWHGSVGEASGASRGASGEPVASRMPGSIDVAIQAQQNGTGHAVQQAAPLLADWDGLVLILSGDVVLLKPETISRLIAAAGPETLAVATAVPSTPKGLGRIVRNDDGTLQKIVEERDCSDAEKDIREINVGLYCAPAKFLFQALGSLRPDNAQNELYLTDIVVAAPRAVAVEIPEEEALGINDRVELARNDRIMRLRLAEELMRSGVTVRDPERLFVEPGITVGRDTELGPGVELRGTTSIGAECRIEAGVVLSDMKVGDRVHLKPYCVASESTIGDDAQVGPWAHIRPGTVLENEVHLGNFVETKKTRLGRGSKANHLSYLGDADIGSKVNVGCGTITCNYDGVNKFKTVIEDGAFIGSDSQLVAPVTVGKGAYVGTGTTVREDVPAGALAVSAGKQRNLEGWVEKKKNKAP
jgi:bifunctional UDP-N-acetylglucosamine pyrophosphorylase/glucosamine-1-phosphate N-acetyltransferase